MSLRTIITSFAAVAGTTLFSCLTAFAALPSPSSPVGRITAEATFMGPGVRPLIRWSADLPAEANAGDHQFFIRQQQLQPERFGWMERTGDRWWPVLGAVYMLVAVKRVRGMRLVGLVRRQRVIAKAAPAVARRSSNSNKTLHEHDIS